MRSLVLGSVAAVVAVSASAQTDDHGDDRASATRVELPSDTEGEIDPGDEDWFRFEVAARGKVTVGLPISGYRVTVVLYDADGEEIATDPHRGIYRRAHIKRTLDAGTYYVRVTSRHYEVSYVLRLLDGSEDDHGDDRASATHVEPMSETAGEIDNIVDEDWFRFEVAASGEVVVGTTGDEIDFVGFLLDADGNTLARRVSSDGTGSFAIRQTLDTGIYYVRITSRLGAAWATGSYVLHIRGEDDHGDSLATATHVELPSQTSGAIGAVDTDWFRFEVPAFGRLTAETARSTGLVAVGRLYDVVGNELAFDRTYTWENYPGRPSRRRPPPARLYAGTYYIQVHPYPDDGATGSYVLGLTFEEDEQTGAQERQRRRLRTLGDFNGDGKDDVLLRHADGRWRYYSMDGGNVLAGSGAASLTRDLAWQIAGLGDFNGDGKDDVLLRKTDGRWYLYPMDGRTVLAGRGTVRLTWDLAWQVAGIADFDGDGTDDVLLRHEDGRWHYYQMEGRRPLAGSGQASLPSDLAWQVAGVGDFDGDGRADVLMRHEEGRWHFHPMAGGAPIAGHGGVGLPQDLAWGVAGVGDFDADGRHDVLLRRTDGRWRYYPMQGRQVLDGAGLVNLTDDTSTTVAGIGDLNGDGRADALARLANGGWRYSALDGHRILSASGEAALTSDLAWGVLAGGPPPGTFRDCAECPLMVRVPAGSFTMGAPESEPHSRANERPQRTISVRAFAAGVYEVTFAEWEACVADGGCGGYHPQDGDQRHVGGKGWGRGDRPVINVGYRVRRRNALTGAMNHVQLYLDWLSSISGQRYRLLTEFEWEYAARAGTTTPFHTGETITTQQANFNGCGYPEYPVTCGGLGRGQTVPVGSFVPNGFGLYDMHGNVSEWVQGCLGRCDPLWPTSIVRGGGWSSPAIYLRSASRFRDYGDYFTRGFRVARTL